MKTAKVKLLMKLGFIDAKIFPKKPFVDTISATRPIIEYRSSTIRLVLRPSAKAATSPIHTSRHNNHLGAGDKDSTFCIVNNIESGCLNNFIVVNAFYENEVLTGLSHFRFSAFCVHIDLKPIPRIVRIIIEVTFVIVITIIFMAPFNVVSRKTRVAAMNALMGFFVFNAFAYR